ncbi:16S rRNA (guanine(527)-N(7))-methyltransferase RsmG [Lysinibacter sp. HNR]|uniref:16S rRNA (guanine(527)-N(7))-methyltransferase RsmG n=1 Tax=Lysinibacter sp. HNR TaxID=3031408 RepID=UPI00243512E3|nr:16S rRNA (guanine(527)-N(7))-methyltransferase RsmG [Lysinibacter sp. HNR]WGD37340.1 16S rRNA (guanine(527)-N(7))-methyltransferase RsmG [Lysinibacter sp. HNR]
MTDVIVETEPPIAAKLFPERIEALRDFTKNLVERGEELGLIGPLELPRIWTRHILNCAIIAPLLRQGTVGDVGSGSGLPGLVLAIIRPDINFVLIEPMERRVSWLNDQVTTLGLSNTRVIRARAEEIDSQIALDQVTARAVSSLQKLIPLTAPLLRGEGELILMKGVSVEKEIAAAAKQIKKYKLHNPEVLILGSEVLTEETRVFRATVGEETS